MAAARQARVTAERRARVFAATAPRTVERRRVRQRPHHVLHCIAGVGAWQLKRERGWRARGRLECPRHGRLLAIVRQVGPPSQGVAHSRRKRSRPRRCARRRRGGGGGRRRRGLQELASASCHRRRGRGSGRRLQAAHVEARWRGDAKGCQDLGLKCKGHQGQADLEPGVGRVGGAKYVIGGDIDNGRLLHVDQRIGRCVKWLGHAQALADKRRRGEGARGVDAEGRAPQDDERVGRHIGGVHSEREADALLFGGEQHERPCRVGLTLQGRHPERARHRA